MLAAFVAAGAATALFLGIAMLRQPVLSELQGGHIVYLFPHARVLVATTLYLLGACVAPLFSSHRSLRLFGLAAALRLVLRPAVAHAYIHQPPENLQSNHTPTEAGEPQFKASLSAHKETP